MLIYSYMAVSLKMLVDGHYICITSYIPKYDLKDSDASNNRCSVLMII